MFQSVMDINIVRKHGDKVFFCIMIFLIFFSGTRYMLGLDYNGYERIFDVIKLYTNRGLGFWEIILLLPSKAGVNLEPLYVLFNKLMPTYQSLLFVMAILGVGIKCQYINKYAKNRSICYFMYFCEIYLAYDMGVMRQGVAMSFTLLALHYLENEKKRNTQRALLFILVGTMFHITALLALPIVVLSRKSIKISSMIIICIAAFILGYLNLCEKLIAIINSNRIAHYTDSAEALPLSTVFKCILIFLLLAIGYYNERLINSTENIYFVSYWYGITVMLLFSPFPFMAVRGTKFFYFTQIFALDNLLNRNKMKNNVIIWAIIILLSLFCVRNLYEILPGHRSNNFQKYIPYESSLFQ